MSRTEDELGEAQFGRRIQAESLLSGVALLIVLTVAQKAIGFGRSLVFCRWLEPSELGRWELAFSFMVLAAPIAVCGIPGVFGRYVEYFRQRGQLQKFLRRTTLATLGMSFIAAALMVVARRPLAWLLFEDPQLEQLVAFVSSSLLAVVAFNFIVVLLESLRQPRLVTLLRFAHSALFMTLGVGLLLWRPTASSIVAAYSMACLLVSIPAGFRLWTLVSDAGPDAVELPHRALWSKLAPAAAAIWMVNLLSNLFELADRWMIVHFSQVGSEASAALVGQYHSSRAVPLLIVGLIVSFNGMFMPYLSHDWEANRPKRVMQRLSLALKCVVLSMTLAGALILLSAPLLFDWLLAGKYEAGLGVLPWTLVYCLWFGLLFVAQNYLWCVERARLVSAAMLVGLLVNMLLNYLWMPRFGLAGAVWATAAANFAALQLILFCNHLLGMRFDRRLVVATLLPLVLALGAGPALIVLGVIALVELQTAWLFSRDERLWIRASWSRWSSRAPSSDLGHSLSS